MLFPDKSLFLRIAKLLFTCLLLHGVAEATTQTAPAAPAKKDAYNKLPEPTNDDLVTYGVILQQKPWVQGRMAAINKTMATEPCKVLFLGDSLTQEWGSAGKDLWESAWKPLQAVNFGLSGDTAGNLLWRINDTKLKTNTPPKVCVLLIGYNDIGRAGGTHKTEKTIANIKAILNKITEYQPQARIILMTMFPYNGDPTSTLAKEGKALNQAILKLQHKNMEILNITNAFYSHPQSKTRNNLFFKDHVHLSPLGYDVWSKNLLPAVKKWL